MTNTFMLAGDSDPEDIIRSTSRGLYCANFGGGEVDIIRGARKLLSAHLIDHILMTTTAAHLDDLRSLLVTPTTFGYDVKHVDIAYVSANSAMLEIKSMDLNKTLSSSFRCQPDCILWIHRSSS